ncbi:MULTISPECIES: serine hydrolase domain-containing protein [unclassified Amycolatopsis]|uniref:serine hydrolase domain-containing protein n=1 Tax=unclassified Amycolatopsis TaxID=2618356 RepID=UPI002877039E|nr:MULTISPECIES: serine hydrolase domain-containing protein [unclassified Amycolatopsis]MDS0134184.1 beta-lactamase family protein [Amycolatopsis sp. 505]MDS0146875.1 beta-lactamase family protein [Amycolatopsis sp. CM201R]
MLDDVMAALDTVLPRLAAVTGTPGVAVAVATSDDLRTAATGFADLAARTPMTAGTVAPAGSLTKPVTGLAFLQLVEAGLAGLDTPVDQVLPAGLRGPGAAPVTTAMLAAHQGGYTSDIVTAVAPTAPAEPILDYVRRRHETGRAVEYGGTRPLVTAPGSYSYSSFGVGVLGGVVEHLAGEPYAARVAREVFAPAGMADTSVGEGNPGGATGYAAFGDWCVPSPPLRTAASPGVGMHTSAADFARLLQSLLRTARGDRGLVGPDSLAAMVAPRVERPSPHGVRSFSGLTLELADPALGEDWWWGHTAAFPWGFWWEARVWPHRDLAAVAVGNRWDMARFHNPATRSAPGLAVEWAGRWAVSGAPAKLPDMDGRPRWTGPRPTPESSHWMGVLVGERTHGLLGVPGPLPVAALTAGARSLGEGDTEGWDADAFGRGVEQARAVAPDPAALGALGRELGPAAALWMLECGAASADVTMPVGFYAGTPR